MLNAAPFDHDCVGHIIHGIQDLRVSRVRRFCC
jgi:hypothetical protein